MSKRVKSWSVVLFGLLVVAALSVGARTALASSTMCPFQPPFEVGSCASQEECRDLCNFYNPGQPTIPRCNGAGCCYCYT